MNKIEQRKEIISIFKAGDDKKPVKTQFNQILGSVSVELHLDFINSFTINRLIKHGYNRFNIASRDYGLRLNIFFKGG